MSELEEIKRRKLEEYMQQQNSSIQQQMQEEAQIQKQIEQLEAVVRQFLTRDALTRYSNLKVAHPEKAVQLLVVLAQLIQRGQIEKIDDEKLKDILIRLTPPKKKTEIRKK